MKAREKLMLVLGIALILAGSIFMARGGIFDKYDYRYESAGQWNVSSIRTVEVETDSAGLRVYENGGSSQIELYMAGRMVHRGTSSCEDGVLRVGERDGLRLWDRLFPGRENYAVLWIPRNFEGELIVSTGSGNQQYLEQTLTALTAESGSGCISVFDTAIRENVSLSSGSGDVEVYTARICGELKIGTGSGEIRVCDADGHRAELNTGSGSVDIADTKLEEADIETGSGDVTLDDADILSLRVCSGSGDVAGSLPGAAEDYRITTVCPTGRSSLQDAQGSNSPDAPRQLYVETQSGDVALGFEE